MPGFLKKAQVYLGLGPDDEYEDFDEPDDVGPAPAPAREARDPGTGRSVRATAPVRSQVPAPPVARGTQARHRTRPAPAHDAAGDDLGEGSVVRTLSPKERPVETAPPPPRTRTSVRPVTANAKPVVVSPTTFNSAQEVGDRFKSRQPVIVNLQGVDRDLSRRLLDFCSGICYALSGHMERVATRVYLLTPADVEVSAEERRRLAERGLAG